MSSIDHGSAWEFAGLREFGSSIDLWLLIGDLRPGKARRKNRAIAASFVATFLGCKTCVVFWADRDVCGEADQRAVHPPSTTRRLPVVKLAVRLAR